MGIIEDLIRVFRLLKDKLILWSKLKIKTKLIPFAKANKKDLTTLSIMAVIVIWLGYVMVNTRGGYG